MMETKISILEILLNTEVFCPVRLLTQDTTYPQICFRQTVLPNAHGRKLNFYVMDRYIYIKFYHGGHNLASRFLEKYCMGSGNSCVSTGSLHLVSGS
jgi:hypothetical protein